MKMLIRSMIKTYFDNCHESDPIQAIEQLLALAEDHDGGVRSEERLKESLELMEKAPPPTWEMLQALHDPDEDLGTDEQRQLLYYLLKIMPEEDKPEHLRKPKPYTAIPQGTSSRKPWGFKP